MGSLKMRLYKSGVSDEKYQHIMTSRRSIRKPMLRGLPEKTVKRVLDSFPPYTWNGTQSTSHFADLRKLHLTRRRRNFKYASKDRDLVAQAASKFLREQRNLMRVHHHTRLIQVPSCPKGKHDSAVDGSRTARQKALHATNNEPTKQSSKFNLEDIDEENDEDMQEYYSYLCDTFDDDPSKTVFDDEFTRFFMDEPGYETEVVKAEEDRKKKKRKLKSALSLEPITNEPSDYMDHDLKRRKLEKEVPGSLVEELDDYDIEMAKAMDEILSNDLHEQEHCTGEVISKSVDTEEISKQTKRKRESASSSEPPTEDVSDHADRDSKRRKLEIGTESFQVSPPGQPKRTRREGPSKLEPNHRICQSPSLAAVSEATVAVGALGLPQMGSSNSSGLDAVDLELFGEGGSDSEQ